MSPQLIDIHPHIVSTDTARYPHAPLGGTRSDWSKERSVDFGQLVAAMDEAGVAKAAIVHSSTTYGFDNAYVADSIAGQRGRFAGVFSVNVTEPEAPAKMRHWIARGMEGMRIYVRGSTIKKAWMAIDDPVAAPAWRCAAELGLSVAVNVLAQGEGTEQIRAVARTYPGVNLIVDHLGRPPIEDGPPYAAARAYWELAKLPNVYLKLTPSGLGAGNAGKSTVASYAARLVAEFGANRIAWGSNYPSSPGSLRDILAATRAMLAELSDADRAWIFGGTAETLYPSLKG